jgi:hypothetical protein
MPTSTMTRNSFFVAAADSMGRIATLGRARRQAHCSWPWLEGSAPGTMGPADGCE